MSDVKLFQLSGGGAVELTPQGAQVEKSLQSMFEKNLEAILGIRFLATKYSTGPVHGGRIDTLGLDEDGSPVIIEFKRSMNENVINQGLFYLDWLFDHRKEFQWLVMDILGQETASRVDWAAPRLLCIAGDFTRYDGHAVKQINRNIELIRYRRFGDDLLMIELVHAPRVAGRSSLTLPIVTGTEVGLGMSEKDPYLSNRIDYRLANAPADLRNLWDDIAAFVTALGDDVQMKELKLYVAFKRIKNFICLEIYPKVRSIAAYVKLDPDTIALEEGFTRDVRKIGHFGTGDLEIVIRTPEDFAKAQPLFQRAYDRS